MLKEAEISLKVKNWHRNIFNVAFKADCSQVSSINASFKQMKKLSLETHFWAMRMAQLNQCYLHAIPDGNLMHH